MLARSGDWRIGWSRWLKAQEYERAFWQRLGDNIEAGTRAHLDWYSWRARQLEQRLASIPDAGTGASKVLEIGSGPVGLVNFLEWGDRYAIDPLERFYRQRPSLIKLRKPGTTYLCGNGEQLPFDDASCSFVIIDNVIDHTYAPGKILEEIHRVLRSNGHLYLSVNVHTRWGALLHALLAVLRIDKGHPYTFTSRGLHRLLGRHRFTILLEELGVYREARRTNCRSPSLKDKIKGYTGLSEFQQFVLCSKDTLICHS